MLCKVYGLLVMDDRGFGPAGYGFCYRLEQLFVFQGVPVSLVDDVVNALLVKGQHIVARQFVMDAKVQHLHSGPGGA